MSRPLHPVECSGDGPAAKRTKGLPTSARILTNRVAPCQQVWGKCNRTVTKQNPALTAGRGGGIIGTSRVPRQRRSARSVYKLAFTSKHNRHRAGWRLSFFTLMVTVQPNTWNVKVIGIFTPPFGWCANRHCVCLPFLYSASAPSGAGAIVSQRRNYVN